MLSRLIRGYKMLWSDNFKSRFVASVSNPIEMERARTLFLEGFLEPLKI